MPIFGSDGGFLATNRGGVIDDQGNTIVSADTNFAASPLGVAARTQALYGIPNATFNLTPPAPASPIIPNQNDLPYWNIEDLSSGVMTATCVFDSTTQTWGVELNPGTATNGSTLALSTRSYLITDDNLALRQKALAVLAKSGTAAGTTQWNLTLDAVYYDYNDTALGTAYIGTALDTATWTSFAGTTTTGGSAINASAQYVDLTFKLTATADITGTAKATIKSLLLTTSTPSSGGFLIADTFTSSGTWTRPTGVDYLLAVVGVAGGGGAASGVLDARNTTTRDANGRGAGGGGGYYIARDLYVGGTANATISVGVGAGGAGGAGATASKLTTITTSLQAGGSAGAAGGNTTFGSFFTVSGGKASDGTNNGGAASNATSTTVFGGTDALGGAGGNGSTAGTAGGTGSNGGLGTATEVPYSPARGTATTPGAASVSGGVNTTTAASASGTGYNGGGGGGGDVIAASPNVITASGNASANQGGGGAGGQAAAYINGASQTISGTAGAGGNGVLGGGGGGGGNIVVAASSVANYNSAVINITSGKGGDGGAGFVTVVYVG